LIDYILIIGSIATYIFTLGWIVGRLKGYEEDIKWIRNFLLTHCIDSKHFSQQSQIKITKKLENLIPISWKDTLDGANINIKDCKSPFDCVVKITDNQGLIRLKKRAEDLNIELNSFLLASGLYIFNKRENLKKRR